MHKIKYRNHHDSNIPILLAPSWLAPVKLIGELKSQEIKSQNLKCKYCVNIYGFLQRHKHCYKSLCWKHIMKTHSRCSLVTYYKNVEMKRLNRVIIVK